MLDYKALPVHLTAALFAGLKADSRIKMRLSGMTVPLDLVLSAAAVDRLSMLVWAQSRDAEKGRNRPDSLVSELLGEGKRGGDICAFSSGDEFDAARKKMTEGVS